MKYTLLILLMFPIFSFAQSSPASLWCASECNAAGDEKKNTKAIFMAKNQKISTRSLVIDDAKELKFELRILFVLPEGKVSKDQKKSIKNTVKELNSAFESANISFSIDEIESVTSELKVEDLTENAYDPYLGFSELFDKEDKISIYIFDYNKELGFKPF